MITVIAAVLERDGQVLACRRRADQSHPLKWEFPGGKVEPGEQPLAALRRELQEELGVRVAGAREMTRYVFQYPGGPPLLLIFFRVGVYTGAVENRIFQEIRWASPADLQQLDFLEGDLDFIRCLADGKLSGP
jgi:8-oxo-dGTP diphosphatase